MKVMLEGFPRALFCFRANGKAVHLTDDGRVSLCGLHLDGYDVSVIPHSYWPNNRCKRCDDAEFGHARVKRMT